MCVKAMQKVHMFMCVAVCICICMHREAPCSQKSPAKFQLEPAREKPFKCIQITSGKRKSSRLAAEGFNRLVYHGGAPEM